MILYNVPEEMDMDQLKQAINEQNAELNIKKRILNRNSFLETEKMHKKYTTM